MSKNKNKGSKSSDAEEDSRTDFSVFMTVFGYCLLIILLPVLTFFGSKQFFDTFEITSVQSNIWSAVSAVICLHLALGLYLYKAYSGDKPRAKPSHQVKQD